VKPDTLMDMFSFMKPDTGLVLQMPYTLYRKQHGFSAVYEQVRTNYVKLTSQISFTLCMFFIIKTVLIIV